MKQFLFACTVLGFSVTLLAQSNDATIIRKIYDEALTSDDAYSNLEFLTTKIGARLSGSPGAAAAVEWSRQVMEAYGFDTVWLQPVMVPHWIRGKKEIGKIVNSSRVGSQEVNICALGGSVGTGPSGLVASVVEVKNFDELRALGEKGVKGKNSFL